MSFKKQNTLFPKNTHQNNDLQYIVTLRGEYFQSESSVLPCLCWCVCVWQSLRQADCGPFLLPGHLYTLLHTTLPLNPGVTVKHFLTQRQDSWQINCICWQAQESNIDPAQRMPRVQEEQRQRAPAACVLESQSKSPLHQSKAAFHVSLLSKCPIVLGLRLTRL